MKSKSWLIFCVVMLVLAITAPPLQAAPIVNMDGKALTFDVPPVIEGGHTLVPLRTIFEALGAEVEWDDSTRTVTATKGTDVISLVIDGKAFINDTEVDLDEPARIVDGRVLVPLRFVSEALDAKVEWVANTETINIECPDKKPPVLERAFVNGSRLVLVYNELLDTKSTPDGKSLTVKVNGTVQPAPEKVMVAENTVILTLASSLKKGDAVSLSYTSGKNPIRNRAGKNAPNFSDQPVKNGKEDDDTPPALNSATVDKASLELTYNEPLDTKRVPKGEAYTVKVNGTAQVAPTEVRVVDDKVILTLVSAVKASDNVTVSYMPHMHPLRDKAGNKAKALIDQPVKNITPPVLGNAVVKGLSLQLTFDVPLDTNSIPAGDSFVVKVNGTVQASPAVANIADNTVTLTLVAAVLGNDAVTVSYTPGTNPLQGKSGNKVEAFTDQPVTNITPPTLSNATVDKAALQLTYNEPLDTTSVPAGDDFTINVNGVAQAAPTGVSVVDNAVILTLASAVTAGNNVTISYIPGTNPVRDKAGNKAETLSERSVTNITPPVLSNAVVKGLSLQLTFDVPLDTNSVPAGDSFVVKVNGTAQASPAVANIADNTVTLTLAAAVQGNDAVTVSYTPGTNLLQGKSGNKVESFTDQPVTNITPPILSNATVDKAALQLTYNEPLDTTSVPAGDAFTVNVNGVAQAVPANVTASDNTVTLTLASAVKAGDTVTVNYTPGTNPIRDKAGNNAAALTNQSVTNNTQGDTTPPAISTATANGASLQLTYNKPLDSTSVPVGDAFTVNVNGTAQAAPASVTVSDNTVTLTLATTVKQGDVVTVSYTPGTSPIRDKAGNNAAMLTNQSVTNNTQGVTTPPVLSTAAVNGDTLQLTYNKPLDSTSVPAGNAFTVNVNGAAQAAPASVTVSESTVTLTLASTVKAGDTVTVSYTPGTNPIRDKAGNNAAALTNQSVSNITGVLMGPAIDPTVASSVYTSTAFLYTGSNPVQTGMAPNTIVEKRAAVLRGKVLNRDGIPLSGVKITVAGHPEFGQTLTREDGFFDMAVNGGGFLFVNYSKDSYLPVQRQINTPWQDFALLPDVVMINYDSQVNPITLGSSAPLQVARGSLVTDKVGSRQATLMFPQGTTAQMVLADGSTQPLTNFDVRATEFTVGDSGPAAMPGDLPPTSGYTYAVDFSVDQAVYAGAKSVSFSQPVIAYLENFLNFPVGSAVPSGYYDRDKNTWIPSNDGKVVKVLGVDNGLATLDIDGSGAAATAEALAALGVTDAERQRLAEMYRSGQSLWRVPIAHFCPWDWNWPIGVPPDAVTPDEPQPEQENVPDSCTTCGSIIEAQNQVLGEAEAVHGTPFTLNYRSSRVPGYKSVLKISLSGATMLASCSSIVLEVSVAGRRFTQNFPAAPNQSYDFSWDGKDAYGRLLKGEQPVTVQIGYYYPFIYESAAENDRNFGRVSGMPFTLVEQLPAHPYAIILWQTCNATIRPPQDFNVAAQGLGGWTLDVCHAFDPNKKVLYTGDGQRHSAENTVSDVINTIAGTGENGYSGDSGQAVTAQLNNPGGVAAGPDGSLYIADEFNNRIRRVSPDGIIATIAGTGEYGYSGDDGPAVKAKLGIPVAVATGPDGSIYFTNNNYGTDSDYNCIRRVWPDGTITRVAGGGNALAVDLTYARVSDNSLKLTYNMNLDISSVPAGNNFTVYDNGTAQASPTNVTITDNTVTLTLASAVKEGDTVTVSYTPGTNPIRNQVGSHAAAFTNQAVTNETVSFAFSGATANWTTLLLNYNKPLDITSVPASNDFTVYVNGTAQTPTEVRIVDYTVTLILASEVQWNDTVTISYTPGANPIRDTAGNNAAALTNQPVSTIPLAFSLPVSKGAVLQQTYNEPYYATLVPANAFTVKVSGNSGGNRVFASMSNSGQGNSIGDGGPADRAPLHNPAGIAVGPDGSLYIADNNRIRRVGTDGIITTVAGTGEYGYSGDGGPASAAKLGGPTNVAVGPDGSLYIAGYDNRIRRVGRDGIITTVAGTGKPGYSGDGGPATAAQLYQPIGVSVGLDGSLFIADAANSRVRWVRTDGTITTLAGTSQSGYSGDGGPAAAAQLSYPMETAVGPDNSIYIVDNNRINNRIRRVSTPGLWTALGEIRIPSEDGSEIYTFDDRGRHLRTVDALTGSLEYQFSHNAAGQLTSVQDGDGNTTVIERDASGAPTAIVAPGGQRTGLHVDASGYLDSITCPLGNVTKLEYDSGGLLTKLTDKKGNEHHFTYASGTGRLIKDENPAGGFTALADKVLADNWQVTATTAMNRTTTYSVETLPGGVIRRVNTWPSGAQTVATDDNNGNTAVTYPDGTVVNEADGPDPRWGMQAPLNKKLTVTTPGGLTATVEQAGAVTLRNSDEPLSIDKLTYTTNINRNSYTSVYDGATKQITDTTPVGRQAVYTLDDRGRTVQEQVYGLDSVNYTYDARGLLTEVRQGDRFISYTYDDKKRVSAVTDAAGNRVQYNYNDANLLTSMTLPGGETYQFGYDKNGNRTQVIMPSGAVHKIDYTVTDQNAGYTPPGGTGYVNNYDLDRAPKSTNLAGGSVININYDAAGRPTSYDTDAATVTMAYNDGTPRVGSITRTPKDGGTAQTLSYTYDGSLVTGITVSGQVYGQFKYRYDNNFNLAGITLDNGTEMAITRDADGQVTGYGPFTITRGGPAGTISKINDGVLSNSLEYDSGGRLKSHTYTVNGQQVYGMQLVYNNIGLISQKTDTVEGSVYSQNYVYNYTYDANGQLTGVNLNGTPVESYTYDANGNRTTKRVGANASETASYDAQDHLIKQGNVNYQFDADGFLASRGNDAFQYSATGELLKATLGNGDQITYLYDGLGRLVERSVAEATYDSVVSATYQTCHYLYGNPGSPYQVTATRDSAGTLSKYYYDRAGLLFAIERGGVRYYVATDQVGTPKVVADATGRIIKTLEYDSFGNLISDSNPTFYLPVGFAGGLSDPETGLIRFGFRDYDPAAGRWTARDPILFNGNQGNLYVYVGNNPVYWSDPLGLLTNQVGLTVSGQVCGAGGFASAGFAGDFNGNIGIYLTYGGGGGVGARGAFGVSVASSNAETINDLSGWFGYSSYGGGLGPYGTGDAFGGPSDHGQVLGGGGTVGAGIGGGGCAGMSYTIIIPLKTVSPVEPQRRPVVLPYPDDPGFYMPNGPFGFIH